MALQALKEGTISAAKCRLTSTTASPSHSTAATRAPSKPPFKSRVVASFDAGLAFQDSENTFPPRVPDPHIEQLAVPSGTKGATTNPTRRNNSSIPPFGVTERTTMTTYDSANAGFTASYNALTYGVAASVAVSDFALTESTVEDAKTIKPPAPLYSYKDYTPKPIIVYTRHEDEANDIVETLKGPLGFDMEWRVLRVRGAAREERRVSVIQICDRNVILVIQVSAMKKFPQKVKRIIENPSIPKIGANIRNDGQKLLRDYDVVAANLVELGALAREADPEFVSKRSIVSLSRIIEDYCDGKVLDKGPVRMSNWEAIPLSPGQLHYAANDAHSALMAYRRLMQIAVMHERTLDDRKYSSSISKDNTAGTTSMVVVSNKVQPPASSTSGPVPPNVISTSKTVSAAVTPVVIASYGPLPPNARNAYRLWHTRNLPLDEICAKLRSAENPLARSTVISYVVRVLQTQPLLPFSVESLKTLAKLDPGSWNRHRNWILQQEAKSTPSS
ncbi:ribonuclease H-like domain-containing protein [Irpex rosettiformis]|uniref:Ribonuclease H-like domain-containing protein n=1 Tax=Irpex rosettiformis TaxID=378272 RepID=A0ACB8U5F8_9APHY|nr:ribonuclease H-like domain-containing protein [Irpex rosettiformis]